jgi:hypothetical protein
MRNVICFSPSLGAELLGLQLVPWADELMQDDSQHSGACVHDRLKFSMSALLTGTLRERTDDHGLPVTLATNKMETNGKGRRLLGLVSGIGSKAHAKCH